MLLSHTEIIDIITAGVIDAPIENVQGSSVDVRLGSDILIEDPAPKWRSVVELDKGETTRMSPVRMDGKGYCLVPGQFILAHTIEQFNMPLNLSAEFRLRSSLARSGLQHAQAVWIDPGFHGSNLTLELKNDLMRHSILLNPGLIIGQIIFHRHAPVTESNSYRTKGRYNNQLGVTASKGGINATTD